MSHDEETGRERPKAYEITFVVRDIGEIETEMTLEELEEMRGSGTHVGLPADVGTPEANRRMLRTQLAFVLHGEGDLVIRDRAGREWIIPSRSLLAAHYRAPWDQPGPPFEVIG